MSRRRVFALAAVALPVLLLVGAEGVLRLAGYGGYPATVLEVGRAEGTTYFITNPAAPRSYFSATLTNAGAMDESAFCTPKPADAFRVVLAGGSAIRGTPQPGGLTAGAFLEAMLADVWPERRIEIINLGTTAVATFPVLDMLRDVLGAEVDLVVIYAGHNEFFGAYGVASQHFGGGSPAAQRWRRRAGGLGLVQSLQRRAAPSATAEDRTLMESVAAASYIGPEDARRRQAAENIAAHLEEMIALCRTRGAPVVVCTLACNERDFAPIGPDAPQPPPATLQVAADLLARNPAAAVKQIGGLLSQHPQHALLHYRMGQALLATGSPARAAEHFQKAVDLDTMPWRAPSLSIEAIRRAAGAAGAILCDVQAAFRQASPGGACGWELFDDHVHFSLSGQALLARTIVKTLAAAGGRIGVPPEKFARLADTSAYAERLGANVYSAYQAAHAMCVLYEVPFMAASNPQARARFAGLRDELEGRMPPATQQLARQWQTPAAPGQPKRPLSSLVAHRFVAERRYAEAEPLLRVSCRSEAPFSSWNFEDAFYLLSCRKQLYGALDDADQRLAGATITRIKLLAQTDPIRQALAHVLLGELCHLHGDYAEAVPHLLAARKDQQGLDLLRTDKALIECYVNIGDLSGARRVAQEGFDRGGEFVRYYEMMLNAVPPG